MKEKFSAVYKIVCLVLLAVCCVKMLSMQNDIDRLQRDVDNYYSMVNSSIDSISSSVRYQLEEANNLLSDSGWTTEMVDLEEKTAVLSCYVLPKEYSPQDTSAAIICNGREIPMTLEKGSYTAQITLSLFDEVDVTNVQFTENGTVRTQQLNWHINPRYDMVPAAYMDFSGSHHSQFKKENIAVTYSGFVNIDFEHKGLVEQLETVEVVMLVNDEEIFNSQLPLKPMHSDEYIACYNADLEHSFELKRGDTFKMYAQFCDSNGWVYKRIIEDSTVGEKGNLLSNLKSHYSEADIYDKDGKLLYSPYSN